MKLECRATNKSESGQALLLAVVIMLMLALVAAAFVATVAFNMSSTGRSEASLAAEYLAEAGLNYANQMLTSSPQGADWRPELPPGPADPTYNTYYDEVERLRGWAQEGFTKYPNPFSRDAGEFGRGWFLLKVEYQPHGQLAESGALSPDERQRLAELSKYIKITAIGRIADDPSIFRKLVAYKPIALTDYLFFVTNKSHSATNTAELGLDTWIDYNSNGQYDGASEDVTSSFRGGVRVNGNVIWHGTNRLDLTTDSGVPGVLRDDKVLASGRIDFASANTTVQVSLDGGPVQLAQPSTGAFNTIPNTFNEPTFLDGLAQQDAALDPVRSVPYLAPPSLEASPQLYGGQSRYLRLAQEGLESDPRYTLATGASGQPASWDHGKWYADLNTPPTPGNYADDIQSSMPYLIDNVSQLVNPLAPRDEAGRPAMPTDLNAPSKWGGKNYELYSNAPEGVQIFITPDLIWIKRTDENASADESVWRGYPYPLNGVIYAQGNVKVFGLLGQSTAAQSKNLTIISDASIIVTGSLLRPSDVDNTISEYDYTNSACALLARQHVIVDPTANLEWSLVAHYTPRSLASPWDPSFFLVKPNEGLTIQWLNGPLDAQDVPAGSHLYMTLLHTGEHSATSPLPFDNTGITTSFEATDLVTGATNGPTLYDFDLGGGVTQYVFNDPPIPDPPGLAPWQTNAIYPKWERRSFPLEAAAGAAQDYLQLLPGIRQMVQIANVSSFDYFHGNWKLERLDASNYPVGPGMVIKVNALMYAEDGTFAIVPGEWWDDTLADPNWTWKDLNYNGVQDPGEDRDSVTRRYLRYNYAVRINGAINENYTAPISLVKDWANKWSYSVSDGAGGYSWRSVKYTFDDSLRTTRWDDGNGVVDHLEENVPRLPALPCSPVLIRSRQ